MKSTRVNMIKNIVAYFKDNPFLTVLIAILFVGSFILFMPWQMVDDGKSIQIANFLSNSLKNFDLSAFWNNLLEPESGRFRPAYWIYLWLTFILTGISPFPHYLIQLGLFVLSAWLVYKLALFAGASKTFSSLMTLLIVIDWRILENWYRLGPQEPIQLPMLLGSLYLFLSYRQNRNAKYLYTSIGLAFITFFIKETNLAFVAVPLYLLIVDLIVRNKTFLKDNIYYFGFTLLGTVLARVLASLAYPLSGYGALYSFSFSSLMTNLSSYINMIRSGYSPLIEIVFLYFIFSVLFTYIRSGFRDVIEKNYYIGLFLIWFLAFFAIQLPWGFTIGRYLLTAFAGLFIMIALVGERFYQLVDLLIETGKRQKYLALNLLFYGLKVVVYMFLSLIIFYQLVMSVNYIMWVIPVSYFNKSFIDSTIANTPRDGRVYLNAKHVEGEDLELFVEMRWHFDYFKNRKDIILNYVSESYIPTTGDIIVTHTSEPQIEKELLEDESTYIFKAKEVSDIYTIVLAGPYGIAKETFKIARAAFGGKYQNSIFAPAHYTYEWSIYEVK